MKKMDIHRWKDNKLNEMLMEKFGYKEKKDPELLKEGFGEGNPAEGKWSEKKVYSEAEESAAGGVPHVPPGDYEGMARAAIAAIVQLASEAGVTIDLTTGPEAEPEDEAPWDDESSPTGYAVLDQERRPSAGAEAGEEELLSPEDL